MVKKSESYETMMSKLEAVIETMSNKEITLDESIKSYEEGISLCNKLYKMLNETEQKIKILTDENKEVDFIKDGD
ncbi:MAG: exodeoxyribonuclease VII small subunit [Bacillota bacterium]|nr:exodeoxyribonuclease VII small subunit [Bacillota bacterium]